MTINLHIPTKIEHLRPTITVVGVGGAGGNAVNNMIASNLEGVNFVVANTDAQALDNSLTERTIQLGASITKGLGAGANPDIGRASAEEASEEIAAYIEGSNMVFITAGMGGGTGTGAAAVVARIAKEKGMLTVAVVTKPFQFEGKHRMFLAEEGLKELQDYVDTLIVIPNQNLFRIANEKTTFADAFKMADEVLHSGVRGVTDLMVKPGLINLDFSDIRTVMREMGKAMMGTGESLGDRRAIEAAEAAISNPLLDDVSLKGARALLVNVTGGLDMTLFEVDEALNRIRDEVDADANIIFGSTFNDAMDGKMRVSVVATGIDAQLHQSSHKNNSTNDSKKPYSFGGQPNFNNPSFAGQGFGNSSLGGQSFGGQTKSEPLKAPPRVAPLDNLRDNVRTQFEAKSAGVDTQVREDEYEQAVPNVSSMLREPAPAMNQQENRGFLHQPASRVGNQPILKTKVNKVEQESARETQSTARGFFKRMAEAGRVLSARHDVEQKPQEPRVQVVQKPVVKSDGEPRQAKPQDSDQYLDIPAFLRRQAN